MQITGSYFHQHDQQLPFHPEKTTVTVNFDSSNKITNVNIQGRVYLSLDQYKDLKFSSSSSSQIRHIQSVQLIKEEIQHTFIGKHYSNISVQKANQVAKEIFKKFEKACTDSDNLFEGDSKENEGAGLLMKDFKKVVLEGKEAFTDWHGVFDPQYENDTKIIQFLNQTPELKNIIYKAKDYGYTVLSLESWSELCFVYENTLLDYKILDKCLSQNQKTKLCEGQKAIDEIYKNQGFDNSLRKNITERVEKTMQRNKEFLKQFMKPRPKRKNTHESPVDKQKIQRTHFPELKTNCNFYQKKT